MKRIKAFLTGVIEFRSDITTHYNDDLIEYYDKGRDLMHRLTFRKFDS